MDEETRIKYFALENVFWLKLSDLMDIVPRYPHLANIHLRCTPMALQEPPSSPPLGSVVVGGEDEGDGDGDAGRRQQQQQQQQQQEQEQHLPNGLHVETPQEQGHEPGHPPAPALEHEHEHEHEHSRDTEHGKVEHATALNGGLTNGYH